MVGNIQIKKGPGGCGDVTVEQKNNLIDHAVSTWEGIGLSDDQIAFGIGVMGLESGFNPRAIGSSESESGLGQFNKDTWGEAVKYYNKRPEHATRLEADIDPDKGRDDRDSQIAVMGPWLRKVWERAGGNRPFSCRPHYNNPDMRDYFRVNVDRARQGLRMRRSTTGQ